jgi:hypothetical protein
MHPAHLCLVQITCTITLIPLSVNITSYEAAYYMVFFMFELYIKLKYTVQKGKATPVKGRQGPYGCETSRLPHYLDNQLTDGGKTVSLMRRPYAFLFDSHL